VLSVLGGTKIDDDTRKEILDADSESKEYMKQQYCKSSSYKCSREMKKNHKLEQVESGY
jgi:dsRNA-specific ribonuclease